MNGGERIQLPMPNIPLENIKIDGLVPIIIHVAPMTNLPFLLGLTTDDQEQGGDKGAGIQAVQQPVDAPKRFKAKDVEEIGLLN